MTGCELMGCKFYKDGMCHYDSDVCLYREQDEGQLNKFPDMDIDCDATECDIY